MNCRIHGGERWRDTKNWVSLCLKLPVWPAAPRAQLWDNSSLPHWDQSLDRFPRMKHRQKNCITVIYSSNKHSCFYRKIGGGAIISHFLALLLILTGVLNWRPPWLTGVCTNPQFKLQQRHPTFFVHPWVLVILHSPAHHESRTI